MAATQKPMAISSITSPLDLVISSSSPSPPLFPAEHRQYIHHSFHCYQRENDQHKNNPTDHATRSSSSSTSSYVGVEDRSPSPLLHGKPSSNDNTSSSGSSTMSGDENSNSSSDPPLPGCSTGFLSLQERRQRNKTASAKYRAKKNQQHHDMRSVIQSLTKENDVLVRQLEQLKSENQQLKSTCDKLRSKMMAEKMLQKMLSRSPSEAAPFFYQKMELDDEDEEQ